MNKVCLGCGKKLQTLDKNKEGFIPENKLEEANYCQRCFRLTHYGITDNSKMPYSKEDLIDKVNNEFLFTIFLTDLLNITDEVINIFKSIKNPKILIINKCEILPKFLKKTKLIKYLQEQYNIKDKILLKGNIGKEANIVLDYLEKNNINKAYLVGLSNSGKSTLINDIIDLTKSNTPKLTVSKYLNTTLDFLSINIKDNLTFIDTPGIILENIEIEKSKKIRSLSFQMTEEDTLALTETYYLKTINKCNINYFTNIKNERVIKKIYKNNLDYVTELTINANEDLIIKGIGFINFKQKTKIKTNIPVKYLSIRASIFGGKNE